MGFDCSYCKHYEGDDNKPPCSECKGTAVYMSEEYFARPLFFEDYDTEEPCEEKVNHPQHYNHGKYECIDVMVDVFGKEDVQRFCVLNAFKYAWRAKHKNGLEDIKKAWFYLDYFIKLEGEAHE